ncbi:MAG: signal recognition particle protein Srp54 [Candidatus Woesearchaeota archaeon]
MVLDKLGDSLKNTLNKIANALFVDETLVNELVKDIQKALLQADVNVKLVFELTQKIKTRVLREEIPKNISKKEYLIRVVYDELVNFLGGPGSKIHIEKKPFTIMLVGLFGNGKTTMAGKLANYYKKRGLKVCVITTDTWRPAAYDQLQQLAEKVQVPFFGIKKEKDPVRIFKHFEDELRNFDLIIVDTAGRDALSDDLIGELNKINSAIKPDESLLVMSADIGQAAERQAIAFNETCKVTGVVITKLDGTAKGGGALIACSITKAPVKFISTGEKIDALEEFKPEGFVSRLLGMGDLELLLEKTRDAITEEEARDMGAKLLKGEFNLIDLYQQMQAIKKMGSLSKILELIPGFSGAKLPKEILEVQEGKLELWKYAMNSMTREELENPDIIDGKRAERIAKGSGVDIQEVRSLIKHYRQSKKLMKHIKGLDSEKGMEKIMQKFQKGQLKGLSKGLF